MINIFGKKKSTKLHFFDLSFLNRLFPDESFTLWSVDQHAHFSLIKPEERWLHSGI